MGADSNRVWLIVLGALLALVTSFLIELYKTWQTRKGSNKNARLMLRLEFKNAVGLLKTLIESFGTKRYFEFRILKQLSLGLARLEMHRTAILYFGSNRMKEAILELLNDLNIFWSDANSLEEWAWSTTGSVQGGVTKSWDDQYFKDQRQMIALRSVDIIRRGEELISSLGG